MSLIEESGCMSVWRREGGEKGKEGSLGWDVQALLFSTLSTGYDDCRLRNNYNG